MKPGRSVASPKSMMAAPGGSAALGPTPTILPSETTTIPGAVRVSLLPSNICAALSTYVLPAGFVCCAGATAERVRASTQLTVTSRMNFFIFFRFLLRFFVLVNHAFFHNEENVFRLPNILERIAGNRHDVGELRGFQCTNLVGQAEEVCVGRGARFECIDRLHAQVDHLVEFFGVAAVAIDRGVSTQSDFHAFGHGTLKCGMQRSDGCASF